MKISIIKLVSVTAIIIIGLCGCGFAGPSTPSSIPVSIEYLDGETGVSTSASFSYTFSSPIDASTVNADTFYIVYTSGSGSVSPQPEFDEYGDEIDEPEILFAETKLSGSHDCEAVPGGTECTFTPDGDLPYDTEATAVITTGVLDILGEPALSENISATFRTVPDTAPPTVSSVSPTSGATSVTISSNITATFSEAMASATISTSTFTIATTSGGSSVSGTVSYDSSTKIATFDPTSDLAYSTQYTATIASTVTDSAGNALGSAHSWSFTTVSSTPTTPTVTSTSPAASATSVAVASTVTATFSEAMDSTTITTSTFTVSTGGSSISGSVSYDSGSKTATFTPTSNLTVGATYTAAITAGAKSSAGVAATASSWSFTTVAPTFTISPTNGATGVAVTSTVAVTFDTAMDSTTITTSTFSITGVSLFDVSYSSGTKTATLTPTYGLSYATSYTVTLTTGIKSSGGIAIAASTTTFTTADVPTPSISIFTDGGDATIASSGTNINPSYFTAAFNPGDGSSGMDASTVTASNVSLTCNNTDITSMLTVSQVSTTIFRFTLTNAWQYQAETCTFGFSSSIQNAEGGALTATSYTDFATAYALNDDFNVDTCSGYDGVRAGVSASSCTALKSTFATFNTSNSSLDWSFGGPKEVNLYKEEVTVGSSFEMIVDMATNIGFSGGGLGNGYDSLIWYILSSAYSGTSGSYVGIGIKNISGTQVCVVEIYSSIYGLSRAGAACSSSSAHYYIKVTSTGSAVTYQYSADGTNYTDLTQMSDSGGFFADPSRMVEVFAGSTWYTRIFYQNTSTSTTMSSQVGSVQSTGLTKSGQY